MDQEERLRILRLYDGDNETLQDSMQNLAQLMAVDFNLPAAGIVFVEQESVFVKAATGLETFSNANQLNSLYLSAISSNKIFVFQDTENLAGSPPHSPDQIKTPLRFFAAAPVLTEKDSCIGLVFIAGDRERQLSTIDKRRLSGYAKIVLFDLELTSQITWRMASLEQKEIQLKKAFQVAGIGTWEFDVETGKATWSDELFEIFGVARKSPEEDLFKRYLTLLDPEAESAVRSNLQHIDQIPDAMTERLTRPDGKRIYVNQFKKNFYDDNGKLVKLIGIAQDVTSQVVNEERLRESEERFKALVQNSSDMIAVLDENANFKFVSPSCTTISGYLPDELVGSNVFDFLHDADRDVLVAELEKVARNTNSGDPTLHRFRTKGGTWIWLESKGLNRLDDSHIGGIIINARDVTERIQLEERLSIEQLNHQRTVTSAVIRAQEDERSDLGRELHDNVNQVLTTVKLYTEMMRDNIGDQAELAAKALTHLQSCIDEIRSISKRLSAPTLGEISVEDSIRELIESINLTDRIEIQYQGDMAAGVKLSPELHLAIYRIIQEQLNNIIKHAGASFVSIHLSGSGSRLSLRIEDNGVGFDPSARRMGMGLTNMRTRAENLGGHFEMKSTPGKGVQLHVVFPLENQAVPGETV
ncbi:PAS domain-containing sensor histidine kinase [Flavisolibacter nicotianae]|uniref:PAS domain-containing sensor histidine kinase n=1 Tax=Flavisolibacter nicotianae TaxID=2364882 RepID=UPI0013C49B79|nr:PAS domain S-box protein [Flavisolibacter nicotianae]